MCEETICTIKMADGNNLRSGGPVLDIDGPQDGSFSGTQLIFKAMNTTGCNSKNTETDFSAALGSSEQKGFVFLVLFVRKEYFPLIL